MTKKTKYILTAIIIYIAIAVFAQQLDNQPPDLSHLPSGRFSEYLPITMHDNFSLTEFWNEANGFPSKTEFTAAELEIIYNLLNTLEVYEGGLYTSPWETRDTVFGGFWVVIRTESEIPVTMIFAPPGREGFVSVEIEDEPTMWFTIDEELFTELVDMVQLWVHLTTGHLWSGWSE
ncbi:MAG: hypothetical protein FWG64_14760 [Firmicutes bacterium]|nr:hypothetical protein [Bacillota bacterium]